MKIFTQQGMSLPLKPPVSRFVATALASRKTGQHASVELACSAAGLLFVSALKMVCLVFGLLRFFLPGSLRGCFSATTSVAKSEVSARGISASYLLMMSGSDFITPWKRISFDHGTSQQTYKRYTISYFDFLYPHVLPRISRTKFAFPPSMEKPSRNPAHIPEGFSQCEPESGFKVCQIGIAIRNVVDYNCGNLAGLPPGWTSDIPKDRKLLPPTGFELPDRSSIITQELYPLFRV